MFSNIRATGDKSISMTNNNVFPKFLTGTNKISYSKIYINVTFSYIVLKHITEGETFHGYKQQN